MEIMQNDSILLIADSLRPPLLACKILLKDTE
jgi:hypothetical protein